MWANYSSAKWNLLSKKEKKRYKQMSDNIYDYELNALIAKYIRKNSSNIVCQSMLA